MRFLALGKMSCDLQAFHQTFFDESKALLDSALAIVAEGARASLSGGQIAELHRCVHGVAGGAATLGFDQPALLARAVEACLDRYRSGDDTLDAATIGRCGEALGLLTELLACTRSGEAPPAQAIEVMIARLVPGVGAPADEQADRAAEGVYSLRFVLSRSLAGADIIIEHVLEDLGRLGRVLRVTPPSEAAEGNWCIGMASAAVDTRLADVLDQIAEPGSLQIIREPGRTGCVDPPRESESAKGLGAPLQDSIVAAQPVTAGSPKRSVLDDAGSEPAADEHLSFWVGDQRFVVVASRVLGVEAYRGELRMPGLPAVLLGMLVVNGELVPLVDTHHALGIDQFQPESDELEPVLLIETHAGPIGLLADRMGERLQLRPTQLRRPRALRGLLVGSPVTGFFFTGDGVCGFLEPDRLCTFLAGFEAELHPLDASVDEEGVTAERRQTDRTMMQAGRGSAIMAGSKATRAPGRRVVARPVARRSLEEEWKQRDP